MNLVSLTFRLPTHPELAVSLLSGVSLAVEKLTNVRRDTVLKLKQNKWTSDSHGDEYQDGCLLGMQHTVPLHTDRSYEKSVLPTPP
jgi:hypothetical protein